MNGNSLVYQAEQGNLQVTVEYYPVDGARVHVSRWDGDDFVTVYESRVVADSHYDLLLTVLERIGYDFEVAMSVVEGWGVDEPDYEEED